VRQLRDVRSTLRDESEKKLRFDGFISEESSTTNNDSSSTLNEIA
jgi:hypothetical protein